LVGVQFTNGDTASGSFTYDADLNTVSNIDIMTNTATYTLLASTFPVHSFEFVFVTTSSLTFGVPSPALVLLPSPGLTDAGGSIPLCCSNGFSNEGGICHDACDGVTTSHQVDAGVLTAAVPVTTPEPSPLLMLAAGILTMVMLRRGIRVATINHSD
jgi:hypothetical protein